MADAAAAGDGDRVLSGTITEPATRDVAAEYAVLKARFKLLQADALSLADEYETACDELRDEQERQAYVFFIQTSMEEGWGD
jgi:hypothetical protein